MTSAPHPIIPQFSVGALHAPNTALSEVTWRHMALQRDGMLVTRGNAVCTHCQETTSIRDTTVPVPEVTKRPSDLPRSKKNNDMFSIHCSPHFVRRRSRFPYPETGLAICKVPCHIDASVGPSAK